MKKTVQRQYVSQKVNANVEVVSSDDLAIYSEEELAARASRLREEMHSRHVAPYSSDAAPWEVELAYIQREQGIRQQRKVLHRQYLEAERGPDVDENSLPEYQGTPAPNWN